MSQNRDDTLTLSSNDMVQFGHDSVGELQTSSDLGSRKTKTAG